ncbi:hypothetical protein DPMN_051057 [Dreissena polymorpha]|uniref:Uncharacterized protein n=1 Tax=Dreissena polymorpha TaxID=45954 RepID=A0A9D4CHW4_DREPO|nr:hypothetical protein DPMN_051057 [Dreissena polymorpha]
MYRIPRTACNGVARRRSHDHERRDPGLRCWFRNPSKNKCQSNGDCAGKPCVDSAIVKEADTKSSRSVED